MPGMPDMGVLKAKRVMLCGCKWKIVGENMPRLPIIRARRSKICLTDYQGGCRFHR